MIIIMLLTHNHQPCHRRKSVNGTEVANYTSEGMLNCNQRREFWVSWDDNKISVGLGALNTFTFLEWHIPILSRHTVRAVGLGSGSTKKVNWNFGTDGGKSKMLQYIFCSLCEFQDIPLCLCSLK